MDLTELIEANEQARLNVAKANKAHNEAMEQQDRLKQQLQEALSHKRKNVEIFHDAQLAQIDADAESKRQKLDQDRQAEIEIINTETNAAKEIIIQNREGQRQMENQRFDEEIKQFKQFSF